MVTAWVWAELDNRAVDKYGQKEKIDDYSDVEPGKALTTLAKPNKDAG